MSRSIHPMGSLCYAVQVEEQYNVVIGPDPLLQRRMCWWSYGSWLGWGISTVVVLSALSICLMVGIQSGSRDPTIELEDLTLDNLSLTEGGSDMLTPWIANANTSVTFQARNPSTVVGFKHRYLYTFISAFYGDTLWGGLVLPPFAQGHKSSGNVTANVVVNNQRVNQSSGWALQRSIQHQWNIELLITVDARVKLKSEMSIGQEMRWFNLTCLVNVSMPTTFEAGRMLSKTCSKSVESAKD